MALNSFAFLLFLAGVATVVRLLGKGRAHFGRACVLMASSAFYALGGARYIALIAASIVFNALVARRIANTLAPFKRRWLTFGVVANVAVLAAFKYTRFAMGTLSPWLPWMHAPVWAFPLGISFFSLQQIMYLVDCYEGLVPAHSLMDHALFVSFFPYVTAGPITRARRIVPQFGAIGVGRDAGDDAANGVTAFAIGVFKKSVLADTLGTLVSVGYAAPQGISHTGAWVCSIAYSLQIYFDFSGYSDMALGAALILGIEIPRNFDAPFRALSMSDFWQRWHITLSQFITTYLYTPMVRRSGRVTIHRAAFFTLVAMTIAGLWHGPSWNYVAFGVLHGVGLAANLYWKKFGPGRLPRMVAWAATLLWVNVAFVFFRMETLSDALHVCRRLLPMGATGADVFLETLRARELISLVPVWLAAVVVVAVERTAMLRAIGGYSRLLGARKRYWTIPVLIVFTCGALLLSAKGSDGSGGAPIIYGMF